MTVYKRPLAFADLAEIWSFIADDNEAQADRFLALLDSKLNLLATQPRMGRLREDLIPDLRSFPVGRYIVYFFPVPDGIDLVRVLHSARDVGQNAFLDEEI